MDILKDKSYKTTDTLSRFTSFPYYYNTIDGKYQYGIMSQLSKDTTYIIHGVSREDTLESLALKYYGRPDYYWVIAMFNDINDAFGKLYNKHKTLKIPSVSNIKFEQR